MWRKLRFYTQTGIWKGIRVMIELDEDCQRWLLTIRKALDLDRLKSKKSIERPGVVVDLGDGIVFFC